MAKAFYLFTLFILRPILWLLTGLEIKRPKNLHLEKPLIIAANHLSFLDPFLVGLSFPLFSKIHVIHSMAADEWIKRPFLGTIIKLLGGFPTYYGKGLKVSLRIPREIIAAGGTVLIFPRGRRRQRLHRNKCKVGAAVLALTTGASILPLKIFDSAPGDSKKFFLRQRKIKICLGQPFSLIEEDLQKATNRIIQEISDLKF